MERQGEEDDDKTSLLPPDPTERKEHAGESIDDILRRAGGFGRYQILVQALSFLISVTLSHQQLDMYFLADDPAWRCTNTYRSHHNDILFLKQNVTPSFCKTHPGVINSDSGLFDKRCELPPDDWHFTVRDPATYSLVTEYKLYCSKSRTLSLAHSAFFIGSSVGSLFLGFFADHYGRKYTLCVLNVIMFAAALSTAFITTTWQFILVRMLLGASGCGCMNTMYVFAVEFVLPEHRAITSNLIQISYAVSIFYLTLVAYVCRTWRCTALYTALPTAVSFIYFALYRSPRWLHYKRRFGDAESVLQKLSTFNKHPIDVHFDTSSESRKRNIYSILDCFKYKKTAVIVITLTLIQFLGGVIYYTMYLEFERIGGNAYLIMILAGCADFPALFIASYFPNKYGRKKSFIGIYILVALCAFPIIFTPEHYEHVVTVRIASAIALKVFFSCGTSILVLWTLEIFPTAVRTQGYLVSNVGSLIGSATAPFVVEFLRGVNYLAPFLVIVALAVLRIILSLVLPETFGKPTRENFSDFFSDNLIVERGPNA